ncbi:sulfite exporter TauE/SafE family protein [Methanospirillum stamsii]|uniref:Probable membrane transporter protein n=2 Tax=Methanospirillum stamsii TaxID=1277351 RepID=A0A2V2MTX6_9EURY|nr:sulfite exporter TauE/SafE family protein [Methanospirillum stamsii]PWR69780.1 hypothetical protein DLD82_16925 [Methanospirillum stamsii]
MEFFIQVIIILLMCGIVAGFLAGLFGIGGGVVMVPVMFILLTDLGYEEHAMAMSVATSAAVILPTALVGTIKMNRGSNISYWPAVILGAGGIIGSVIGSTISVIIPKEIHIAAFSGFLIFMAIWMGIKHWSYLDRYHLSESTTVFIILGILVGIGAGLFGIGGGVILTPVLTSLVGMNIHRSIGISLTAMVFIASGTVLSYILLGTGIQDLFPFSIGYVNILFMVLLVCTSIPAVRLGVRTGQKTSEKNLLLLFICMLMILAVRMLFSLFQFT